MDTTGFDNVPHYTYNLQRDGRPMLTFTWNGFFSDPIKVSRDGYGEPTSWTINLEEINDEDWLKEAFPGDVTDVSEWESLVCEDPTMDVLEYFGRICNAWYATVYQNPEVQ